MSLGSISHEVFTDHLVATGCDMVDLDLALLWKLFPECESNTLVAAER